MKLRRIWIAHVLAAAAAAALVENCAILRASPEGKAAAKVIRLQGNARYSLDQTNWKTLKKGVYLKAGALLQTAPNSSVDLCLKEARGTSSAPPVEEVIRLLDNSVLSFEKLSAGEIQFELRGGSLMGSVAPLTSGENYEIKLPHGFVGIRGGTYIADASGAVNVINGSAVVVTIGRNDAMTTQKLTARQGFDPTTGNVVALDPAVNPAPLTCSGEEPPPAQPVQTPYGLPKGPGMGGSMRKF